MAEPASGAPTRKSLRAKLLLCLLAAGLSLLALEVGLRLLWHPPAKFIGAEVRGTSIFLPDAELGWKMAPNRRIDFRWSWGETSTIETNSLGFRDVEHPMERTEGVPRVMVLGDSHAFGYGVQAEQTFAARLRESLPGVEILNLAQCGYVTRQERALFEEAGAALRPDVVILAFCQNDVDRQVIPSAVTVTARQNEDPWYLRNIRLVRFLRDKVNSNRSLVRLCVKLGIKDQLAGYEMLDTNLRPALRAYPPDLVRLWEDTCRELRLIRDACKAAGAEFLVVFVPARPAVDPSRLAQSLTWMNYEPEDFDFEKPSRLLREFCDAEDVPLLDAYPALVASQRDGKPPYLEQDMHINATGHRILADLLAPRLKVMLHLH